MDCLAAQLANFLRRDVGQVQMRDVDIRLEGRVVCLVEEGTHAIDAIEQRQRKRFELERDRKPQRLRMVREPPTVVECRPPLFGGRNDFAVPDVLAQDKQ